MKLRLIRINTAKGFAMTDTGGSAFPVPTERNEEGMSLRDYFAAKAMQGLLCSAGGSDTTNDNLADINFHTLANESFQIAEAMLKARVKDD